MPEPVVDSTWIERTAQEQGYHQDHFERAVRLAHLLREVGHHPFLRERVALKGGTAINFFFVNLPRLSVDMDLNYVGSADKAVMQEERPVLQERFQDLVEALGYEVDVENNKYGSWKVRFLYENAHGGRDSLRLDLNYLIRVPLYGVTTHALPTVFDLPGAEVPCLEVEDVYGGKLKALATRTAARDLYDAHILYTRGPALNPERLRRAFLFYCFMEDATLNTVDLRHVEAVDEPLVEQELHPVLRGSDRPTPAGLRRPVLPKLKDLLKLQPHEQEFGQALEEGSYKPELLFQDGDAHENIAQQPIALRRAQYPHPGRSEGMD